MDVDWLATLLAQADLCAEKSHEVADALDRTDLGLDHASLLYMEIMHLAAKLDDVVADIRVTLDDRDPLLEMAAELQVLWSELASVIASKITEMDDGVSITRCDGQTRAREQLTDTIRSGKPALQRMCENGGKGSARRRYRLRADYDGTWAIVDIFTGQTAHLDGIWQDGWTFDAARKLVSILNVETDN